MGVRLRLRLVGFRRTKTGVRERHVWRVRAPKDRGRGKNVRENGHPLQRIQALLSNG